MYINFNVKPFHNSMQNNTNTSSACVHWVSFLWTISLSKIKSWNIWRHVVYTTEHSTVRNWFKRKGQHLKPLVKNVSVWDHKWIKRYGYFLKRGGGVNPPFRNFRRSGNLFCIFGKISAKKCKFWLFFITRMERGKPVTDISITCHFFNWSLDILL